jgi:DNA-binding NarL/FixJ family response regulator
VIRVLIVAPYASVRAGLHALLADDAACAVIGTIGGSAELQQLLPETRPDVVLLDDNESDGARVAELLAGGDIGLVVLGDHPAARPLLAGADLPGWGYLLKDAGGTEIAAAVRAVAAGLVVLDRRLMPRRDPALPLSLAATASPPLPDEALTAREREVLHLMAEGLQNRQIAARLHLSPHTVKFHVAAILAKLGAASRTEAVTLAARRGDLVL